MNQYKKLTPEECGENFFQRIGKGWMLLTAKDRRDGRVNCMTASWGGIGVLWHQDIAFCVVRPQRYTYEFIENSDEITFQFFDESYRDALTLCGRQSGRDVDKIEACNFTLRDSAELLPGSESAFFDEAELVIVGEKLFLTDMKEENFLDPAIVARNYPNKDFHRLYVCRIDGIFKKA